MQRLDPEGKKNLPQLQWQASPSGVRSKGLRHATAQELREILGAKRFRGFKVFGFIRYPKEKMVSTYFFLRSQSIIERISSIRGKSRVPLGSRALVGVSLARCLPFTLWARVWPMKRCSSYFMDASGDILVDFLGSTARLDQDLISILKKCGVEDVDLTSVPRKNRSSHGDISDYFNSKLRDYIERKYSDDLRLYRLVELGVFENARG